MELFPSPSKIEIEDVRELLKKYPSMCHTLKVLDNKTELTIYEQQVYQEYSVKKNQIEMAVQCILDQEIRGIIHFRFIEKNQRWATVTRWDRFTDRSLDRKIVEGIESIAGTLKLIGAIK
ncbi:hypothetical protein SAMN05421578_103322 [Paenibacillus macquariensis]|uniref:Phage ABA sandwich domain-containing protein n=2 Tax=Paenibacillus macquariensis TaxID=948756 RepID=A0ABY1JS46_9BACL|nr:hypothetical protein SAMN05421578_103322 [Paenibacillus macquariensis]